MSHRIHPKLTGQQVEPIPLNALERRLLNDFQRDLPLSATPYADMAEQLGVSEQEVMDSLQKLKAQGAISRVGAVIRPNRVGVSTLAAVAAPAGRLEEIAQLINSFDEVNHNYEREHEFNLWFVVTARDQAHLQSILNDIETDSGCKVLALPMLEDYHIDLGFELKWS